MQGPKVAFKSLPARGTKSNGSYLADGAVEGVIGLHGRWRDVV